MPRIWDAFLFNDELHLLQVRLRMLAGIVDHVVIVEGTRTFSGQIKPMHFASAGLDLSFFPGTVTAVACDLAAHAGREWDRENSQRAAMGEHLRAHASQDDLILLGDVDELPRPAVLQRLVRTLVNPTRLWMSDGLYFANWHQPQPWTLGPLATRLDGFGHPSVQATLGATLGDDDRFDEEYVADAGWHLSFLGGPDGVVRKLAAYSHAELNTPRTRLPAFLDGCLRYGSHFAGWAPVRKVDRAALDPELAALSAAEPTLFEFAKHRPLASRAWCAWAWLRPRLPLRPTEWLDAHPLVLFATAGPALILVQVARDARHRLSPLRRWPPGKRFVPSRA